MALLVGLGVLVFGVGFVYFICSDWLLCPVALIFIGGVDVFCGFVVVCWLVCLGLCGLPLLRVAEGLI